MDLGQLQRISNFLGLGGPKSQDPAAKIRIGVLGASQVLIHFMHALNRPHVKSHMACLQVSTYAAVWPSRRLAECEVVAVAARDVKRAAEFARMHSIGRYHGSYEELLDDPDIDAVYVGLPNGLHGKWTSRCVSGNHPLICLF